MCSSALKSLCLAYFAQKIISVYTVHMQNPRCTYKEYFRFRNFVVNSANKAFFGWDSDFYDFLNMAYIIKILQLI